ncbi:MAG TPA: lipoxygenase family protein [Chthoniobacterales bacterium]|nr:lipoxygenase family protein [Chthoniobacterales bacterium]
MQFFSFSARLFIAAVIVLFVNALIVVGLIALGILGFGALDIDAFVALGVLLGVALVAGLGLLGPGPINLGLTITAALATVTLLVAGFLDPGHPDLGLIVLGLFVAIGTLIAIGFSGSGPINVALIVIGLSLLLVLSLLAWAFGFIPLGFVLISISILGLIAELIGLLWFIFQVHRLPLPLLGLEGQTSMPAVPFWISVLPDTILKLSERSKQIQPVKEALSNKFTLEAGTPNETTATGYTFMYGEGESRSLDSPEQFAMGWTTWGGIDQSAAPLLPIWASSLSDANAATTLFWPTFAKYNLAFNLAPLERVSAARAGQFRNELGNNWTAQMDELLSAGRLYVIDLTIFSKLTPPDTALPQFTPSTLTFLEFEPAQKAFTPFLIQVSNGAITRYFTNTPATASTWLYALQAAKVSLTVWGIWLGHVYHFHIVTSAMQMTMFQCLRSLHPIRQLLGRQSQYLIGFDEFLLLDWAIGPPTSITNSADFLRLLDAYAKDRTFFADDPKTTLQTMGLHVDDFTTLPAGDPNRVEWDLYPVARYLLALWDATATYVGSVISANYADDQSVANDAPLQRWIKASADPFDGNIRGLPTMNSRAALTSVLTSLIYRITAHGASRTEEVANPALTFMANFPPCLEDSRIPDPNSPLTTRELLAFLPKTGTMGAMATFLFTFVYTPPYVPFIPVAGVQADLSFRGPAEVACNNALIQYRRDLQAFMELYAADSNFQNLPAQMNFQVTPAQIHQWELNIEE